MQAGKRQLTLSNLDKPLFPDGFTKGEVIRYYSLIAPVLLPYLTGRPVTTIRNYPRWCGQRTSPRWNCTCHSGPSDPAPPGARRTC